MGDGTTNNRLLPVQVRGLGRVKHMARGALGYSNYAVTEDNETYAWGYNTYGRLGLGSRSGSFVSARVGSSLSTVSKKNL